MKNNKSNFQNEEDAHLEFLIINLIYQGVTLNELMTPTELIKDKEEREKMKSKVTTIVLNFIDNNPEYIDLINDNISSSEFLNNLGLDML